MENITIQFTAEDGTVWMVTPEEYFAELIEQNTVYESELEG